MRCQHCQGNVPRVGYCCDKAELEALRGVVDEVASFLAEEAQEASIACLDGRVVEPVAHAARRLVAVRRVA